MAKQFSNREKALITSIYNAKDSNTYVLTNVFIQWLDPAGSIRYDMSRKELVFDYDKFKDSDIILNIKKEIISTALLVKYLEEEGYIYIIQDNTSTTPPAFVGAQNIHNPLSVPIPPEIAHILDRSLYNVYVSYDLRFFVEKGFKTYEDLQLSKAAENLEASQKQIRISRASLLVSALALVCTLIMSQCSNCSQYRQNEAMLNALAQFEDSLCTVNKDNTLKLSAHIDSLGVSFSKHNTQNVDVTKASPRRVTVKKQYNLIQIDTINCDGKQYIVLPIKK